MKKIISLTLLAFMVFGLLAGCGTPTKPYEKPEPKTTLADPFTMDVSEPETLYTKEQRDEKALFWWPDGSMGVTKNGGSYSFYAANSKNNAKTTGTLDDPAKTVDYAGGKLENLMGDYDYLAGGPVFTHQGVLYMIYHFERHHDNDAMRFYSGLGLAYSNDQGKTFTDLGTIMQPNIDFDHPGGHGIVEVCGGAYIIDGGYIYVYFRDRLNDGAYLIVDGYFTKIAGEGSEDIALSVMRASLEDIATAQANGTTPMFIKYYDGEFSQPGVSGLSSNILGEIGSVRWFDFLYDKSLNEYVMIYAQNTTSTAVNLFLARSADKINWSIPMQMTHETDECFYPTAISTGDDPKISDGSFYVFYTQAMPSANRWTFASVKRIEVKIAESGPIVKL